MPSSSKRSFEEFSLRGCKTVVGGHVGESNDRSYTLDLLGLCRCGSQSKELPQYLVGYRGSESSTKSVMPQSSERPFEDKIDQILKKSKRVVDCPLGESSDRSSALDLYAYGSRSQKLAPSLAVGYNPCESCQSPTLSVYVTGFKLEEAIRRVQEMGQLIIHSIAPMTDVQISSRKEREFAVDWSELEVDILVRIAENYLLSPAEFAMFSSVCRSWHRAAAACNLVKLNKKWISYQMPWVMLTDGEIVFKEGNCSSESSFVLPRVLNDIEEFDDDLKSNYPLDEVRSFLNLRSNKYLKFECVEGYGRVCWGSAHGWIVTAGGDGVMFMLNPFTKSRVGLPSFGTFRWRWDNEDEVRRHYFVTKAVVLDVGGDDDPQYIGDGVEDLRVVVFYGNDHVAIVKPGNRRWIEIEGEARTNSPLMDVTYDSKLGLIFVDNTGGLLCCSVPQKEESPFLKWFQPPRTDYVKGRRDVDHRRIYIVKCGADLLMVTRFTCFDDYPRRTEWNVYNSLFFVDYYMRTTFKVDRFVFANKTWDRCWELKDVALFVGNNTSMWSYARGGGCIYFNDDLRRKYAKTKYKLGGHDCGVVRLNPNESLGRGHGVERNLYGGTDNRSAFCGPLFFKPSICVSKGLN